jgi:hypothetical protein
VRNHVEPNKVPDVEQLKAMLHQHVSYELAMLIHTYSRLTGGSLVSFDVNALIEAFCVHARNLNEFFQSSGTWPDSLHAKSFTTDYKPGPPLPQEILTKMNQQITHLSWGRTHDLRANVHHDALEFPDGEVVLLTQVCEGQHATVLQLRSPRL